ncbi:unnamed protein product [Caenorhabditis brenneri]
MIKDPTQSIRPFLPIIDYSAQSLDQCGTNRDEQHFAEESSNGRELCEESSAACKNSSGPLSKSGGSNSQRSCSSRSAGRFPGIDTHRTFWFTSLLSRSVHL